MDGWMDCLLLEILHTKMDCSLVVDFSLVVVDEDG